MTSGPTFHTLQVTSTTAIHNIKGNTNFYWMKYAIVGFILVLSFIPAYGQEEEDDITFCSFTEFDPECSPSGWVQFLLGDVVIALTLGYLLYRLGNNNIKTLELTTKKIEKSQRYLDKITKEEEEHKRKITIFATQSVKNYFGVILIIIGLMNRALTKGTTRESIPAKIWEQEKDLGRTIKHLRDTIQIFVGYGDPMIIEQIRRLLDELEKIDPASGIGEGFPNYTSLKETIKDLSKKMDESTSPDDLVIK